MSKVVSILEKPRDIYEINSVATRYKSKKVLIYIYDQANYKFQNLKNYILEKKIQNINYKIINLKNINQLEYKWEKITNDYNIFVFPYQSHFFLCKKIRDLKKLDKKVVLLSNGTVDCLKIYELILSSNRVIDLLKNLFKFFYYKLVFPVDFCSYVLFPLKVSLAKNTYKVDDIKLSNSKFKQILINKRIDTLFVGSGKYPNKKTLEYYKIKNYCYTSKYLIKKKIALVNGSPIKLKNLVISEEILNLKNIKNCIGILSTSTFYALLKKKNVSIVDTEFLEGNFFYKLFLKLKFNRIKKN